MFVFVYASLDFYCMFVFSFVLLLYPDLVSILLVYVLGDAQTADACFWAVSGSGVCAFHVIIGTRSPQRRTHL